MSDTPDPVALIADVLARLSATMDALETAQYAVREAQLALSREAIKLREKP
jgi:hypothetical protein